MWEWLLNQTQSLVNIVAKSTPSSERDDVVQEVMLHLIRYQEKAQKIYSEHQLRLLSTIIKEKAYYHNIKDKAQCSRNIIDRRKQILDCCKTYGIAPIPSNAYKISPLLLSRNKIFTITFIANQLSQMETPVFVSVEAIGELADEKSSMIL